MPTKFKKDSFEFVGRGASRKSIIKKNYIKATSRKELEDYLNNDSGKPKLKQKCSNELIRRGINFKWVKPVKVGLDLRGLK